MILSRRSQYCMISKTPQICRFIFNPCMLLTHWGRVTQICVGKLTIIDSDNGLSPGRRQAIIWTNAGILLIGLRGTSFSEILIGTQAFSLKKMHLKMSSAKGRPICLGFNVLSWSNYGVYTLVWSIMTTFYHWYILLSYLHIFVASGLYIAIDI